MTARGLLFGTIDEIEFVVAETLGKFLYEVRAMPNSEIEEWRGRIMVQRQAQELARLRHG